MTNAWTVNQYRIFRVLLGAYLLVHFVHLLPWAAEVFSSAGMLAKAADSPLIHAFPNVLAIADDPWVVVALIGSAAIAAVAFAAGRYDRVAAVWMVYVLACLFGRNPLIANPSLPYVGWMLLLHVAVPKLPATAGAAWRLPPALFLAAWVLLAVGYSYSAYTKFASPAWVSADAVRIVLDNPLARDYWLRGWLLASPPWLLQTVTLGVLYLELAFAPLALLRRLRPWIWLGMLLVQGGFLMLLNFADLTAPMFLLHLITFDPAWLRPRRAESPERIFYDGECGFCHGFVRFVLGEDRLAHFRFAPLQAESARRLLPDVDPSQALETMRVQRADGTLLERSRGAAYVLERLGGLWHIAALLIRLVPRPIADAGYDAIARVRRRLAPPPSGWCPVLPAGLARRFES